MIDKLNKEVLELDYSKIREFSNYAQKQQAQYFLTIGEPDNNSPSIVKEATRLAIKNNQTHYSPDNGYLKLREKISEFEKKQNKVDYTSDEVLITVGSTEAITISLKAILNPDDELMVFLPAYPLYKQLCKLYNCKFIGIEIFKNDFEVTKELLEANYSLKTKCLVLNNPNNPTGLLLSDKSLENIYEFVKEKKLFVVCDDTYNNIVFKDGFKPFSSFTDLKEQIIVCQSFSKTYAMTGWRIGYLLADKKIMNYIHKVHQYSVVCVNSFIQEGALKAIDYDIYKYKKDFQAKRDYSYQRLKAMNLKVKKPMGAFYIFPNIEEFEMTSLEFCQELVTAKKVAITPSSCFDAEGFVRIAYCVSMECLIQALDLLEEFISEKRKELKLRKTS